MGKVVKLEVVYPAAVPPCRGMQAALCSRSPEVSPLTPALKEFIDRAIVPALVEQYLADVSHNCGESPLAEAEDAVALSERSTAATRRAQP